MDIAIFATALSLMTLANAAAPPPLRGVPPVGITLRVAPGIPPQLVAMILDEADAIWRPTGISFVWQREPSPVPTTLRVAIGDERRSPVDGDLPLGWVVFNDSTSPEPEIYLSYANALEYMKDSRVVIGMVDRMPLLERFTYLSRALGRALAHELGHYLLASKAHTAAGLMQTHRSAIDLFGISRHRFVISPTERATVAARLTAGRVVVSR